MRKLLYMAHPVAPSEEEIAAIAGECVERGRGEYEADIRHPIPHATRVKAALRVNLDRALAWLAWLRKSFPEITFIAPWISIIQSLDGNDSPALREAGLVDDCTVVERCDGIVLCGVRVSSGMARERDHGMMRFKIWMDPSDPDRDFTVYDLTCPTNPDPPMTVGVLDQTLEELADMAGKFWRKP